MAKRVGVLLSGCGLMDGSEIHEAVLTMLALDMAGAEIVCCAPDAEQKEVVDHLTGEAAAGQRRNMLVESARIARGEITDLAKIRAQDLDALILPGGYGAAKNLSDYASRGAEAQLLPEVERVVREFAEQGKPIGAICISPVVVARAFKDAGKKLSLTIGDDESTSRHIAAFGAEHVCCPAREFVVDRQNKVVSTPAYMLAKGPGEVYAGIEKLVRAVLELCESR